MKKIFTILLTIVVGFSVYGQKKERQHTGFFLSMGLGGVFGPIHINSNVDGEYDMSGVGGLFDLKIGGAVKENLILSMPHYFPIRWWVQKLRLLAEVRKHQIRYP